MSFVKKLLRPFEHMESEPQHLLYMVVGAYVLSGAVVFATSSATLDRRTGRSLGMNSALVINAVALLTPLLCTVLLRMRRNKANRSDSFALIWLWILSLAIIGSGLSFGSALALRILKPACTTSAYGEWTPEKTENFAEGMLLGETMRAAIMLGGIAAVQAAVYGGVILSNQGLGAGKWPLWLTLTSGIGLIGGSIAATATTASTLVASVAMS